MITNMKLKNFKCFKQLDIDFAPLTLLTGLNSSGKSTIIQALRIINNGKLLEGYGQCVSIHGDKADIDVRHKDENYKAIINKQQSITCQKFINNESIEYIGADRFGPQVALPFRTQDIYSVGDKAKDVLSYINKYCDKYGGGTPEKLRMENYENISSIKEQIKLWLNIISPEFDFDFQVEKESDSAFSTYTKNKYRAKDVGFGLSYNLPIIASAIINAVKVEKEPDACPIIIIENPEAHLHPSGQTKLGKFIALVASCKVQVIVETHSDHFLNGVRLGVKENKIINSDISINYLNYDAKEEASENTPIFIDEQAMLDEWPKGFFDETEKTLLELL
jgi:predicted ATPase